MVSEVKGSLNEPGGGVESPSVTPDSLQSSTKDGHTYTYIYIHIC